MLQIQNKFEIGQKVIFNFGDIEQEGIVVGYDYMRRLNLAPKLRYFICSVNDYADIKAGHDRLLYKIPEECLELDGD